ncbi:phosphoglycerate mutase family protein [Paenisporosarcina quisquiliarum]|uniref:phosphoglycerate mutase family protein n=1 Tax=Paenisporosarcina quisquiliarum TaxID=365346 RepID=UPI0037361EF5
MELVFIRHGQGEHTMDVPRSLQLKDPSLKPNGVKQAELLRNKFPLTNTEIVFISLIRRSLQTAFIWSETIDCRKIVSPFVSPRMFPILPRKKTLPCDETMDLEIIIKDYPTFEIDMNASLDFWSSGINVISDSEFVKIAEEFIEVCKLSKTKKFILFLTMGQSLLIVN